VFLFATVLQQNLHIELQRIINKIGKADDPPANTCI